VVSLELRGVRVERGDVPLLDGVDLVVGDAERVALLGPSGSGKTTLLRAVAGLEPVTAGTVRLHGRDVTHVRTRERNVAMVDQQASLQPHLDVAHNVGFPLRLRRTAREEIDRRVEAEASAFSFRDLLRRRPRSLSAGERHEVALARSLVRKVDLLLLDEPLARTDPPRRGALIRELVEVQQGYGVGLLCATNDQRVAMSLAHRCSVLHDGRIVQTATPAELFRAPATTFVAGFLGTPPMNLLPGRVERGARGVRVVAGPLRVRSFSPAVADLVGRPCVVGVRPTAWRRAPSDERAVTGGRPPGGTDGSVPKDAGVERSGPSASLPTIEEVVRHSAFSGSEIEVHLGEGEDAIVATIERPAPEVGELLRLTVDHAEIHLFDQHGHAVTHGV
jgi:multiple sugar transport system ATP-binding protein